MKTALLVTGGKNVFIVTLAVMESILIGLSLIITFDQYLKTKTDSEVQIQSSLTCTEPCQVSKKNWNIRHDPQ